MGYEAGGEGAASGGTRNSGFVAEGRCLDSPTEHRALSAEMRRLPQVRALHGGRGLPARVFLNGGALSPSSRGQAFS